MKLIVLTDKILIIRETEADQMLLNSWNKDPSEPVVIFYQSGQLEIIFIQDKPDLSENL